MKNAISNWTTLQSLAERGKLRCNLPGDAVRLAPAMNRLPAADRIEGMLLGIAIGDALGNTTEGMTPAERMRSCGEIRDYLANRYAGGRHAGTPTDDTQLSFWALESMLERGGVEPQDIADRFSQGTIYGIGGSVTTFLRAYESGAPWYEAGPDSAGNGALMRVAPFVLQAAATGGELLFGDIITGSAITHNDSASIASCAAFAVMLRDLLYASRPPAPSWWVDRFVEIAREVETDARYTPRGGAFGSFSGRISQFVLQVVPPALADARPANVACDNWLSGAFLLETVPSVLYILARHAADPEEAIVRAVNDTKDNDTAAAIVGAAAGALHGASALPRRWLDGLTGRTGASDDGTVQRLARAAAERYGTR